MLELFLIKGKLYDDDDEDRTVEKPFLPITNEIIVLRGRGGEGRGGGRGGLPKPARSLHSNHFVYSTNIINYI
jgi:hypothetical protein